MHISFTDPDAHFKFIYFENVTVQNDTIKYIGKSTFIRPGPTVVDDDDYNIIWRHSHCIFFFFSSLFLPMDTDGTHGCGIWLVCVFPCPFFGCACLLRLWLFCRRELFFFFNVYIICDAVIWRDFQPRSGMLAGFSFAKTSKKEMIVFIFRWGIFYVKRYVKRWIVWTVPCRRYILFPILCVLLRFLTLFCYSFIFDLPGRWVLCIILRATPC